MPMRTEHPNTTEVASDDGDDLPTSTGRCAPAETQGARVSSIHQSMAEHPNTSLASAVKGRTVRVFGAFWEDDARPAALRSAGLTFLESVRPFYLYRRNTRTPPRLSDGRARTSATPLASMGYRSSVRRSPDPYRLFIDSQNGEQSYLEPTADHPYGEVIPYRHWTQSRAASGS